MEKSSNAIFIQVIKICNLLLLIPSLYYLPKTINSLIFEQSFYVNDYQYYLPIIGGIPIAIIIFVLFISSFVVDDIESDLFDFLLSLTFLLGLIFIIAINLDILNFPSAMIHNFLIIVVYLILIYIPSKTIFILYDRKKHIEKYKYLKNITSRYVRKILERV